MDETLAEIKEVMDNNDFVVCKSNLAKYMRRKNNVVIYVAAYVASNEVLYKIGNKEIKDNFFEYTVWTEKDGVTIDSLTGCATGSFPKNSFQDAVSEQVSNFLED